MRFISCIVFPVNWALKLGRTVGPALPVLVFFVPLSAPAHAPVMASPVEFNFKPTASHRDPWGRELWADIVTPSGAVVHAPAYFVGDGGFAVRARADEAGDYRLGKITETAPGATAAIVLGAAPLGSGTFHVSAARRETRRSIGRAAGPPPRLVFSDGAMYTPFGVNLAWAPTKDLIDWYRGAFTACSAAGLNWTRVWMAHWSGQNLDWLPPRLGRSPPLGELDFRVADNWDRIVSAAEQNGIYLQIVLQHHGQYSSDVNSNWAANPWNAANPGGFLRTPAEFFTSPRAIALTKRKYRYIVARWGYSPTVLAWELFNEVHWVDAVRRDHAVSTVAHWHDEMAAYIRSLDPYHHLVTTSTDDLQSPIYASMDYFQPHLYAVNMLAAVRRFDLAPTDLDRPVFYGEVGSDHMLLTSEQKNSAVEFAPIAWAGVMGAGRYPAQLWEGATLLAHEQLGEIGAVARFLAATRLGERDGLIPFAAEIQSTATVPLRLVAGEAWKRRSAPTLVVAIDGRALSDYASIPQFLVGSPTSKMEGFPDRVTFRITYAHATTVRVRLAGAGPLGATIQVLLDGHPVASHSWPKATATADGTPAASALADGRNPGPVELQFPIASGTREIVLRNDGGADWVEFESLDFGLPTSALTAVGRRGTDFMALWVWQRDAIFARATPDPIKGRLILADVAAGTWQVTWWDTAAGVPAPPIRIKHPGGVLELPTPAVARSAAVVLTRTPVSAGDK